MERQIRFKLYGTIPDPNDCFTYNLIAPIYDFNKNSKASDWTIVNDGVMGGLFYGNFTINQAGNGVFSGTISLENNGGFSSVRYRFAPLATTAKSKVVLRIKGDGKSYQFRIKDQSSAYFL